jgi:hypothetical protein
LFHPLKPTFSEDEMLDSLEYLRGMYWITYSTLIMRTPMGCDAIEERIIELYYDDCRNEDDKFMLIAAKKFFRLGYLGWTGHGHDIVENVEWPVLERSVQGEMYFDRCEEQKSYGSRASAGDDPAGFPL